MNTIIRGVTARWVWRPVMVLAVALAAGAGLAAGPVASSSG
jgi:hypothetical protein